MMDGSLSYTESRIFDDGLYVFDGKLHSISHILRHIFIWRIWREMAHHHMKNIVHVMAKWPSESFLRTTDSFGQKVLSITILPRTTLPFLLCEKRQPLRGIDEISVSLRHNTKSSTSRCSNLIIVISRPCFMTSYHTRPVARLLSADTVTSISDVNQAISDAMIAHCLSNVGLNALCTSGRIDANSVLPVQR